MIVSERVAVYKDLGIDLVEKQSEYQRGEQEYKNISQKVNQLKRYNSYRGIFCWIPYICFFVHKL